MAHINSRLDPCPAESVQGHCYSVSIRQATASRPSFTLKSPINDRISRSGWCGIVLGESWASKIIFNQSHGTVLCTPYSVLRIWPREFSGKMRDTDRWTSQTLVMETAKRREALRAVPAPLASCPRTGSIDRLINGHGPAVCQTGIASISRPYYCNSLDQARLELVSLPSREISMASLH